MIAKEMIKAFVAGMASVIPLKVYPPPEEPRRVRSVSRHFEKAGERIARSARREISGHVATR